MIDPHAVDWPRVSHCTFTLNQRFTYAYSEPIVDLRQRLVVLPPSRHGGQLKHSGGIAVDGPPAGSLVALRDAFGNTIHDIHVPRVEHTVTCTIHSQVRRSAAARHLEPYTAVSLERLKTPTPLTTPNASLRRAAARILKTGVRGRDLALAISHRVHRHFHYEHGVTGVSTTAAEAWSLGRGVCQDYAHAMVALCRACGLPAKYVSGQLAGEGGTHAWVEVLLVEDGTSTAEILALDPTLDRAVDLRYLTVAVGRDYRDVMPTSGFYTGKPASMLSHIRALEVISVRMQSQRHRATA